MDSGFHIKLFVKAVNVKMKHRASSQLRTVDHLDLGR